MTTSSNDVPESRPPHRERPDLWRLKRELVRFVLPLCFGLVVLWNDSSWRVVLWGIGVVAIAASMGHLFRRFFFPYFDFREYAEEAMKGNTAAGIALLAVALVLCTLIYVFATFIRP